MPDQTIYHGDCLEVMRTIKQDVHLVFADPPYNIGIDYGTGKKLDSLDEDRFVAWCEHWITEALWITGSMGQLWVLINERWADCVGLALSAHIPRVNRIIWRETFGQYHENFFPSGHRHLFWHAFDGHTWNPDAIRVPSARMEVGDTRASGPRVPDDVWDVSRLQGNANQRIDWHPTQLNRAPLERIVRACTNPGDTVFEPFSGSAILGVVSKQLGRNYIGCDINPEYVRRGQERIDAAHVQLELFD